MLAVHVAEIARVAPQFVLAIAKSAAFAPVTAMLLMVIADPGPLDKVNDCAVALVPTDVEGNERLEGEAVAVGGVTPPVPESATACGLPEAESVKLRLAVRVPEALGLKTSVAVHAPPTESVAPHVFPEITKSDAFVPITAMPLMVRAEVLPLDSVMDCDVELLPTAVLANATADGLAATTPLTARPESAIVCGLLPSESVKFRVAVLVPVAVGPKTMFAVQLAPDASIVLQVLLKTVKSPELAPLKLRLLMLMVAVPGFESVTTFCPPLLPTTTAAQLWLAGDTVAGLAALLHAINAHMARSANFTAFAGRPSRRFLGSCCDVSFDEVVLTSVWN
jgi:hypothetical protein